MSDVSPTHAIATALLHAGQPPDPATGSRAPAIHQTTSYVFQDTEHARKLFALEELGWIYTRLMNPTTDVLEQRLAALDGGVAALAVSSGQQAITVALLNYVHSGGHIVAAEALYGGAITLLGQTFKRLGIEVTFVDATDPANIAAAIRDNTRAVYVETIANPKNCIYDYAAIAQVAHDAGVPAVIDNTAAPYIFRPLDHGFDTVVYSLTKFIGGHGTSVGGAIIDAGRFDFFAQPARWPQFTEPDGSYHGAVFGEVLGNLAYIMTCRTHWLRDLGGALSPFNAFLFLQGLETLHLRMPAHCDNALKLATWLSEHPDVAWVNHPGLPDSPYADQVARYLPNGAGAILGFGLKNGFEGAKAFIENVQLASHLANIGDAKTLVIHPASTTHSQQTPEQLAKAGIGDDYIRVSVGIEAIEDILADFEQAIAAAKAG